MTAYLYRGVDIELYEKLGGALRPKESLPFSRHAKWDKGTWDDSSWAESVVNGVVEHQIDQAGFPTSGVSTTLHFERARYYATHGGVAHQGFVYIIDRARLTEFGVSSYIVNELLQRPSVPEDDEVILVARDFGDIPTGVIFEVRAIGT